MGGFGYAGLWIRRWCVHISKEEVYWTKKEKSITLMRFPFAGCVGEFGHQYCWWCNESARRHTCLRHQHQPRRVHWQVSTGQGQCLLLWFWESDAYTLYIRILYDFRYILQLSFHVCKIWFLFVFPLSSTKQAAAVTFLMWLLRWVGYLVWYDRHLFQVFCLFIVFQPQSTFMSRPVQLYSVFSYNFVGEFSSTEWEHSLPKTKIWASPRMVIAWMSDRYVREFLLGGHLKSSLESYCVQTLRKCIR